MKNLFELPVFNSRISSKIITKKEMWLGYFAGPICVIFLNAILTNYLNVYYTDVIDISNIWGGLFLSGFPIVVKIIDAFTFVIMGRIVDRTTTNQGKARPWILFSAPLLVISTILLFAVPKANDIIVVIWIFFSYNLFYSIAFTAYNTSHTLMVPLSTKDETERNKLSLFTNSQNMAAGLLVAIVFPCFIIPMIGVNQTAWIRLMTIVAVVAFPFILMEYFYTKERVTETKKPETLTLKKQWFCCLKSKQWIMFMVMNLLLNIGNSFFSAATFYYCNWVLGSYNDGYTQALFYAIGQLPLGVGIFLCMPMCKKFGRTDAIIWGFVLSVIGTIICLINPYNLPVVLIGQFIKSFGLIPSSFLMPVLLGEALDDVQKVSKVRCDGFSSSVFNSIGTISVGVALGIFNLGLTQLGYQAPISGDVLPIQNPEVVQFLIFAVIGCQAIIYSILAILLKSGKQ